MELLDTAMLFYEKSKEQCKSLLMIFKDCILLPYIYTV